MNSESSHYPQPPKAYKNRYFINSHAARSIRIQCELTEPEQRFLRYGINHTIVVFGSARIKSRMEAEDTLKALEREFASKDELSRAERLQLARAQKDLDMSEYYEKTAQLTRELVLWSKRFIDRSKQFAICSGGGPGIMEAANRGAQEGGGPSMAFGITLAHEQHINPYADEQLSFEFHYFFVRKYWFLYMAKAMIAMPGGFGTLDELFEILTLIQTGKVEKHIPIILFDRKFWTDIINFEKLVEMGTISPEDLNLFHMVDSVDEAMTVLKKDFAEHFLNNK